MKKWLAALSAFFGLTSAAQGADIRTMSPNDILMSIPTISDDLAALEDAGEVGDADLVFHEDDWAQVEFYDRARLEEVKAKVSEFKVFEEANRQKHGWKKLYVRKIARTPMIVGSDPVARLASVIGVKPAAAPVITSAGQITGRVRNGFTLPLGGNVTLYGFTEDDGIPVLAASVGADADNLKLTDAFMKISDAERLILVDWRGQMILVGAKDGQIEVWQP
jgi:hypothetical protein